MTTLLSTREVAELLDIHEKKVYRLITEQGLPATKVTGKWLFPKHLVLHWLENNTLNYPDQPDQLSHRPSLLVFCGSNDILLDRCLSLFMRRYPEYTAVFGNLGSLGGLRALKQGLCHIACSHLQQEDSAEFNFDFAAREMDRQPVIVNFSLRRQGLILPAGNPKGITGLADLASKSLRIVNRPRTTGTRLWFDRELADQGVDGAELTGYQSEVQRHLDAGLEVLNGLADAAPGIQTAAAMLGLGFLPLHVERFDLLIHKERFFDRSVQSFLGLLHEQEFHNLAEQLEGYDLSKSGKIVYPGQDMPE
jgi:excisionase family DNA binding protein